MKTTNKVKPKCEECDGPIEVLESSVQWTPWGRCVGHFAWQKVESPLYLCEECEADRWIYCTTCGALVDDEYYGTGYLPDDYEDDNLCPECAEKAGYERTVGIGSPYGKEAL